MEWIKKAIDLGVGEILITSIDRDGTKHGYELDLIKEVASFVPVPVIGHGGAGSMESIRDIIVESNVDAISASSVFHYGDFSVSELKKYLGEYNIHVRF